MTVWVVEMLRWGDREMHSYVIGVYTSEEVARKVGREHREYRGGKYEPHVQSMVLDEE